MPCEIPEFGRCCFFLPLRRGVATFGYTNAVWSSFMIFTLAHFNPWLITAYMAYDDTVVYYYTVRWQCSLAFYSMDIILSILLVFGAHLKIIILIKAFVYYTVLAVTALFMLELIQICTLYSGTNLFSFMIFFISGSFNIFMAMVCWSLVRKLQRETSAEGYQNPLEQFVNGDLGTNTTDTTIPITD